MATATNTRLRKAVEALLTNPPHDNDPWRKHAPPTAGWHLSGDLWRKSVCAQTHTATVRKALKEQGLIEEKRVTKPSTRRGRPAAHTTAIRLKHGRGFRHVLCWLLRDYYLYVKYYREYRAPYFERNAKQLATIKQKWSQLIEPIGQLLTSQTNERSYHRDVIFAELFEYYLEHEKAATTLIQQLGTALRKVCMDAPPGMQHRCRTDFLVRILCRETPLKQAEHEHEVKTLLKAEVRAFNKCLENHIQAPRSRTGDVWL
jgi:hypothetical protein